jgi:hypothetical protein
MAIRYQMYGLPVKTADLELKRIIRTRKELSELLGTCAFGLQFNVFQLVKGFEPRTAAGLHEGECLCMHVHERELTRRTSGSEPCTEIVSCFEATVRTSSHGTSKWLAVWEASKKLNCSSCILAKCRATSRTADK